MTDPKPLSLVVRDMLALAARNAPQATTRHRLAAIVAAWPDGPDDSAPVAAPRHQPRDAA